LSRLSAGLRRLDSIPYQLAFEALDAINESASHRFLGRLVGL
jgi:hypothetical protein